MRNSQGRRFLGALTIACFLPFVATDSAQDTPAASSPPGVRITFLPPPLEGTLSVGVYTVDGKLVRTLAREATERDFTIGLNGFITQWDRKNDAGKVLENGKYFVRGYAVAPLHIEGVAFHANDWLSQDEQVPRVSDIVGILVDGSELLIAGRGVDAKDCVIHLSRDSDEMNFDVFDRQALLHGDDVRFSSESARSFAAKCFVTQTDVTSAWPGKDGTTWAIENTPDAPLPRRKVLQRSLTGEEILRELQIQSDEPQPVSVAASLDRDEIYLLERDANQTRIRGLSLKRIKNAVDGRAVSEWELCLSKSIYRFPAFEAFASQLKRSPLPQAVQKLRVSLIANALLSVAPAAVQISVGLDENGSFLQTLDGLVLCRITDTPHLQWAALTTEPDGTVSLFQTDGAAVEEYRLGKLDQMMAFDAGEYDLTAPK